MILLKLFLLTTTILAILAMGVGVLLFLPPGVRPLSVVEEVPAPLAAPSEPIPDFED